MPCDSIAVQSLSGGLEKAIPEVLRDALGRVASYGVESVGAGGLVAYNGDGARIEWQPGRGLVVSGRGIDCAAVRAEVVRQYSAAAVAWAARRSGFKIQQTGARSFVLARGGVS